MMTTPSWSGLRATARCASGSCSARRKWRCCRAGIDENLEHLSRAPKWRAARMIRDDLSEDFCNWQDNEHYRRFIFDQPRRAAGRLMRSSSARLYHDHMLTKEPGTRNPPLASGSALLQYRRAAERQFLDSGRSGESRLNPGVRRRLALGPWLMPRPSWMRRPNGSQGSLADLPNINAPAMNFAILAGPAAGRRRVLHSLPARGRGGDRQQPRRVFSVRFLGDDITHAPRRWRTSPEFPGWTQMPAGAPMSTRCFRCCALAVKPYAPSDLVVFILLLRLRIVRGGHGIGAAGRPCLAFQAAGTGQRLHGPAAATLGLSCGLAIGLPVLVWASLTAVYARART